MMDFFKKPFLWIPFVILVVAVSLDKLLVLEKPLTYFTKTMSDINFKQKEEVYQDMKLYLAEPLEKRRKVMAFFGNSRSLLFDVRYIHKTYPEWTIYNFSVPGGRPDYTLYWLERFQSEDVKPEFVVLDDSTEAYNSVSSIHIDDVLSNGLSISFVLRHIQHYSTKDLSTFFSKRMIRLYQYRPKLETILARAKNDGEIVVGFRAIRAGLFSMLKEGQGSARTPGSYDSAMPEETLKKSAWGDFHSYLDPFHFNENTLYFQRENARILKEMNIPFSVIWVRLSRLYFALFESELVKIPGKPDCTVISDWNQEMAEFRKEYQIDFWNMNQDPKYSCDNFADAGHMAPSCFEDYTDYIFRKLKESGQY